MSPPLLPEVVERAVANAGRSPRCLSTPSTPQREAVPGRRQLESSNDIASSASTPPACALSLKRVLSLSFSRSLSRYLSFLLGPAHPISLYSSLSLSLLHTKPHTGPAAGGCACAPGGAGGCAGAQRNSLVGGGFVPIFKTTRTVR